MSGIGVVSVSGTCVESECLVLVYKECVWYWCRESVSGTGIECVCLALV